MNEQQAEAKARDLAWLEGSSEALRVYAEAVRHTERVRAEALVEAAEFVVTAHTEAPLDGVCYAAHLHQPISHLIVALTAFRGEVRDANASS